MLGIVLGKVLGDKGGFDQGERLGLARVLDCDDRRLAERVDLFQIRASELVVALVCFDLIWDLAFLQQPDDALSPRLFEPDIWSGNVHHSRSALV